MNISEGKTSVNIESIKLPDAAEKKPKKRTINKKSANSASSGAKKNDTSSISESVADIFMEDNDTKKERDMKQMKSQLKEMYLKNPTLQKDSSSNLIDLGEIDQMTFEELETRILLCRACFSKKFDNKVTERITSTIGSVSDSIIGTKDEVQKSMVSDEMLKESLQDCASPLFSMLNPTYRALLLMGFHIVGGISVKMAMDAKVFREKQDAAAKKAIEDKKAEGEDTNKDNNINNIDNIEIFFEDTAK